MILMESPRGLDEFKLCFYIGPLALEYLGHHNFKMVLAYFVGYLLVINHIWCSLSI